MKPGDFITSTGALLPAPPAAVRDVREGVDYKAQIQAAFNGWVSRRPDWIAQIGTVADQEAATGALKQIYSLAALGDQIIEGNYLASQSRTNRNSFIEHIIKAINDDYREAYDRLVEATPDSVRTNWSNATVTDKSTIYSNIITSTLGTPKDPDTSYTAVTGVDYPDNFDPSQDTLRRT